MRSPKLKFPGGGGEARNAGYAVMVLGIIVLAGVLYQFYAAMNEIAYWDLRIASMDRRIQRKTAPQVSAVYEKPEMKREVRKANAVMSELDLPWGALFDSIEYAASHDVALLSIQPDASSRKMRIGGEAKNISAMLDFVGALEREPALKDAHLLKYEIKRDDPHRPVTFLVSASWA